MRAFTIVTFAAPASPLRSWHPSSTATALRSRANLTNVEPDPEHVRTGMQVRLATYSLGTDSEGTEAVGFAFEPAE